MGACHDPREMTEGTPPLLERDSEGAALERGLQAAARGSGTVLVIEGPAGIGKTAVLDDARRRARSHRMQVLDARGAELEREIANGVVRQLLERPLRTAPARQRAVLLEGAAGLAAPAVLPQENSTETFDDPGSDRRSAVLHGLYWLVSNIAAQRATLLAIDDVQWADAASLRFLAYLARRVHDLPVLVVATQRSGETSADRDALAELSHAPSARVMRPQPLSLAAIGALVRGAFGTAPPPPFVSACHDATGGVPFLAVELLKSLAEAGLSGDTVDAAAVTKVTSETVAHATLLRLSRLSPDAAAVAQCVAIAGRHADVRRVSLLCDLDERAVLIAIDALVARDLARHGPPVRFVHPIVRASIYDAVPRGRRSLTHAAAARLLAAEGADIEDVAAHLLAAEAGTTADAVATLRAAAAAARTRGAPESAAAYLERAALEMQPPDSRAQTLYELAQAQSVLRRPQAVATFGDAMQLAPDDVTRARFAMELVETLMVARRWDQALREIDGIRAAVGGDDPGSAARLEVFRAQMLAYDVRRVEQFEADRPRFERIVERGGRAGRLMAALLAACAFARAEPPREVVSLSHRALDDGTLMGGADAEAWGPYAAGPLAWLGERDAALTSAEQMRDAALRRGSVYGFVRGTALHALVLVQRGDLRGAEADIRAAVEVGRDGDTRYGLLLLLCWASDALLERPALNDVAGMFEHTDVTAALDGTYLGAWFLETRGRLRLMRGDRAAARTDLQRCGALMDAFHTVNPMLSQWRSACALAMPEGERSEAERLVEDEVALARAAGARAAEAGALRAAGVLRQGAAGVALLRQSSAVAEGAGAPLEHARTLVALGAALRRSGQRAAAEEPLRRGLDLAHTCGADSLAGYAEEELRTIGLRPRRRALVGVDALTPSELRVARAAARGLSNRDIAQSMFVSSKTVESQLSSAYQKLGIRGRDQLAAALEPASADA